MPEESRVKNSVKSFLEREGYDVLEKFNIGVIPDLVAYKWLDDGFQVEAIAVECKGSEGRTMSAKSVIDAAITQAREYQLAFPYVYLATPPTPTNDDGGVIRTLEVLRIGLIFVDDDEVTRKVCAKISPRLAKDEYILKVRQRLAAISAYREVFGMGGAFDLNVQEPEVVHCYNKTVAPNYLLTNYWRDYYCGICLEQAGNVKKVFKGIDVRRLHELIGNLPETYIVEFAYIDTYKPREVSWPLLRKHANGLTQEEAGWIFRYANQANWRVRLMIIRKVWERSEVLGKEEHVNRLKEVEQETSSLYSYLSPLVTTG